ncbi:hypothetical protein F4553_006889 [Allocatelliglobosispora scoriae]|uniref:Uncharacterized protein n=1 Tax=Allocatelliglobosispora scoriae TaxID=643052 RepID=A0A841C0J6_9ACTN|nr:hypothetical protein [Allocatelliglobosispora scoriae]MBB5873455.1 hypothetical protein [Allocatelliglobosispora scoriae]
MTDHNVAGGRLNGAAPDDLGDALQRVTPVRRNPIPAQRRPDPEAPAVVPGRAADQTTSPTRKLCTLVHVEDELRTHVNTHLSGKGRRAWAPCYAVDLIALLWHTGRATRLALTRDVLLSALLFATLVVISLIWFGLSPVGLLAVVGVCAALGALRWLLVRNEISLATVVQRIVGSVTGPDREGAKRTAVIAAIAIAVGVFVVVQRQSRLTLLAIGTELLLSWLIIVTFSVVGYVRASRVLTSDVVDRGHVSPRGRAATRARQIENANVLIYARDRAHSVLGPFVGAGHRIMRWTTSPVNVALRSESDTAPKEVDVIELHEALATAARGLELPSLQCEHRLYIDGRSLADLPELHEGRPEEAWLTATADEFVLRRVAEPQKYQRGYLCLKTVDSDGDVVVTMFVRAMLERDLLQIEVSVHALPEVTWPKAADDGTGPVLLTSRRWLSTTTPPTPGIRVPPRRAHAAWRGIKEGSKAFWATRTGRVSRCAAAATAPVRHAVAGWVEGRTVARDEFDFGAETSLREFLAMNQRLHYNALIDMMAQAERLQHRLVHEVDAYLRSCGIDTLDFTSRSITLITNNFNDLQAGAVTFGNNSPATGSVTPPPPPNPGHQERQ